MKTIKQTIADNKDYKTLINAVVKRIGKDSIEDVNRQGADSGFSGFIYYSETHSFSMRHRKIIIQLLEDQASQMDIEVVEMVSNFGIFRNSPMNKDDRKDLYRYLSGAKTEQGAITNIMAWFALEEVCRMFEEC